LQRAVLDVARGLGCAEAWVLTDRANTAAMRLYAAAGSTEAPTDHVMFTFTLDAGTAPGGSGGVAGASEADPGAAADRGR
jgi:aminoglycoside 6'-N-acetyltransferase I